MPVSDIKFQGINRTITDYASAGACEELINLRPTGTGLIPVKPFVTKIKYNHYERVFVHKADAQTNYIAIDKDEYDVVHIFRISDSGVKIGDDIAYFSASSLTYLSFYDIFFSSCGNVILFSISDERDNFYLNLSFIWDGGQYCQRNADIPNIQYSLHLSTFEEKKYSGQGFDASSSKNEIIDDITPELTAIQENNKEYCFGTIIIAFAFRTKDGKTFWTNKWLVFDPSKYVRELNVSPRYYVTSASDFD